MNTYNHFLSFKRVSLPLLVKKKNWHPSNLEQTKLKNALSQIKQLQKVPLNCGLSYAWEPEGSDPEKVESQRVWVDTFAQHLKLAGCNVSLDLWKIASGEISSFTQNIASLDKVLLIGTPLLKLKADQPSTHIYKETLEIIKRSKNTEGSFLFLITKEGNHTLSFPDALQNYPSIDMRNREHYVFQLLDLMASLLDIDHLHPDYERFVAIREIFAHNIIGKDNQQIKKIQCLDKSYDDQFEAFCTKLKAIHNDIYSRQFDDDSTTLIPRVFMSYPWGTLKHEFFVRYKLDPHLKYLLGTQNQIIDVRDNLSNDIGYFIGLANEADRVFLILTEDSINKYEKGMIKADLFSNIDGINERKSKLILSELRRLKIIDHTHFLIWVEDMEEKIKKLISKANWGNLQKSKAAIIKQLHKICDLYRVEGASVLSQEISIINNARSRNLRKRGSVVIAIIDGMRRQAPPFLEGFPKVFFNSGTFQKQEFMNIFGEEAAKHWKKLVNNGYLDINDDTARLTKYGVTALGHNKLEFQQIFGEAVTLYLETVPRRNYHRNFLKVVEYLQVPELDDEEMQNLEKIFSIPKSHL